MVIKTITRDSLRVQVVSIQSHWRQNIKINNSKLLSEKYTFNATKNPKDKGPFPEYTLWYYNDELLKMEFKNPNDKKNTISKSCNFHY